MADNKNPNEKQPGEKPEGKLHYNPGNPVRQGGRNRPQRRAEKGRLNDTEAALGWRPLRFRCCAGACGSMSRKQQGFCSCYGTAHFDLHLAQRGLSSAHRGWVHFIFIDFRTRRAAVRKCLRFFVSVA
jgi:hypothetical protein